MAHGTKRQRPGSTQAIEDGMKLHLREVRAGGRLFRVVTPRPGTDVLFSTNYFHDTWHVITDAIGARLIARLLWGLAYQRQPDTVALLHGEFLRPTPFDADPSDPVLFVPAHLTRHDADAYAALRRCLSRLGPPTRTVRWHTPGLDERLSQGPWRRSSEEWALLDREWNREHCARVGGFVCYTALPEVLKFRAYAIYDLGAARCPSNYAYLAEREHPGEGEVQTFRDYRRQLSQASVARREVLAELEDPGNPETLREWVWKRKMAVARRG